MEEIVRVTNLKHEYPDGTAVEFRGQDLVVHAGERVAILGSNGSGKTTLLFHLLGLLKPTAGTVRIYGHDPARDWEGIREQIGVVLQDPDEQIIQPLVRDDIGFSPRNYGYSLTEVRRMVQEIALELGIVHLLDKVPHHLSGGERLKVALAGALVLRPQLLIMDEPFESLDGASRADLIELLDRLHTEHNVAVILSTHQVNMVPYLVDRVYVLARGGAVVAEGTPESVLSQTESLATHHLEVPVLGELFWQLRRHGIILPPALTVREAADVLRDEILGPRSSRRTASS